MCWAWSYWCVGPGLSMINETRSHRLIKRLAVIEKYPSERVAPGKRSRHDAITNRGPPMKRQRIGDYLMCSSIAPKKPDRTKTAKSGTQCIKTSETPILIRWPTKFKSYDQFRFWNKVTFNKLMFFQSFAYNSRGVEPLLRSSANLKIDTKLGQYTNTGRIGIGQEENLYFQAISRKTDDKNW